MHLKIPIGMADFRALREGDFHYVDKSEFVQKVLYAREKILLIPRPRRFGKSLNLSLLRAFIDCCGESAAAHLMGLSCYSDGSVLHFRSHPVIFLRLPALVVPEVKKGARQGKAGGKKPWLPGGVPDIITMADEKPEVRPEVEQARAALRKAISQCVREHQDLLQADELAESVKADLRKIMQGEGSDLLYRFGLRLLSHALWSVHRSDAVILIDDYDATALSAVQTGCHKEVAAFLRDLFDHALRQNEHLWKAVLTGSLPGGAGLLPASVPMYSDSPMNDRFATCFGLTEHEVLEVLEKAGLPRELQDRLRRWYGGHRYGRHTLYQPFSTLSCLASLDHQLRPYFASTRSSEPAREALLRGGAAHTRAVLALLSGAGLVHSVADRVEPPALSRGEDGAAAGLQALWTFLLYNGYLTWQGIKGRKADGTPQYLLNLPNQEARWLFRALINGWLAQRLDGPEGVKRLAGTLLSGKAAMLGFLVSWLLLKDRALGQPSTDLNRLYHGLTLGLALHLDEGYRICLARLAPAPPRPPAEDGSWLICESDEKRRYDLVLIPRSAGKPGVVLHLEMKSISGRISPQGALDVAVRELQRRNYGAQLRTQGIRPIHEMVVMCNRKAAFATAAKEPSKEDRI